MLKRLQIQKYIALTHRDLTVEWEGIDNTEENKNTNNTLQVSYTTKKIKGLSEKQVVKRRQLNQHPKVNKEQAKDTLTPQAETGLASSRPMWIVSMEKDGGRKQEKSSGKQMELYFDLKFEMPSEYSSQHFK